MAKNNVGSLLVFDKKAVLPHHPPSNVETCVGIITERGEAADRHCSCAAALSGWHAAPAVALICIQAVAPGVVVTAA
jgi:hypothetical protein